MEGDVTITDKVPTFTISIHTFRVEGDFVRFPLASKFTDFNPHLPWKVTYLSDDFVKNLENISIHTFRVEGDWRDKPISDKNTISIHTFRVEGDAY